MTAAAMTPERNIGRAQTELGSQCLGAVATTPTLPISPMADNTVRTSACGSEAAAIGRSQPVPMPTPARRMGAAQQAVSAAAAAIPPVTSASAPLVFVPSFIWLV